MSAVVLSQAEIEGIRATLEGQMFQSARVWRRTLTADATGGHTDTLAEVSTSPIKCRIMTGDKRPGLSLVGQVVGDQIINREQYTIYFPHDADVQADDLVTIGERTFRLTAVIYGDCEFTRRATAQPHGQDEVSP